MNTTLTIWDYITLGSALLFVVIFSIVRIKELVSSSSGGCGCCSAAGSCSAPLTKQRLDSKSDVCVVGLSSIEKNKRY